MRASMNNSPPSLTKREAEERAALVNVSRYDIDIDLTGMAEGPEFRAVSTISFTCREPGASTFVDAVVEVLSATLNGAPLPDDAFIPGRITLSNLRADNVLVVESVQNQTAAGNWVRRSVDPSDQEVYAWMTFEPDDARRAWACFDQPDLKAPHRFTVLAPEDWTVVSNSGDPLVEQVGTARRWTFSDTPPLSTYVPVVCAGPFHEIRSERGGFDLGLFARRSLAQFLERDAEELFELTAQGLVFFGEQFGMPFPQRKYDQVFAPDMGGAMENYGCVTWSDAFIYRSSPTHMERETRALTLLHEMAHMWFGDIVTMRWWEDLWLNEAFAEWACHWAAEATTRFTDAWAAFLVGPKVWGYGSDMAPTTHPIRQPVDDVAAAAAGFDGITYPKGASVLKQLFAFIGEDTFLAGLRAYFKRHAWGNTILDDLMEEFSRVSGRDLREWTRSWLDTAGTDRLVLEADGRGAVLRASGPDGAEPRAHRLVIGTYDRDTDRLTRTRAIMVETKGHETRVEGLSQAHLLLVNDEDLTFASVRPPASSIESLVSEAARLPTAMGRALAFATAWDMLLHGDLPTAGFLRCVEGILRSESVESLIEPAFQLAIEAADLCSPDADHDRLMSELADLALAIAESPARRQVALRALAQSALTDQHFAELTDAAGENIDLAWRTLVRRATVREVRQAEVEALQARDPDPDAWVRALAVNAARPEAAGKDAAWKATVEEHRVPGGSARMVGRAFWQRSQGELLAPYMDRYLELLPTLHAYGMGPAMSLGGGMFPRSAGDEGFVERAIETAQRPDVSPMVQRSVIESCDRLRRRLQARRL